MNTTILHINVPNIHVFVTSWKNVVIGNPLASNDWYLEYWEGGTECKYENISDGEVDEEDVDEGSEFIVGGHGETNKNVTEHSTQHQYSIDQDYKNFIVGDLGIRKYLKIT